MVPDTNLKICYKFEKFDTTTNPRPSVLSLKESSFVLVALNFTSRPIPQYYAGLPADSTYSKKPLTYQDWNRTSSGRSLIKTRNKIAPKTDPSSIGDIEVKTGHQQQFSMSVPAKKIPRYSGLGQQHHKLLARGVIRHAKPYRMPSPAQHDITLFLITDMLIFE